MDPLERINVAGDSTYVIMRECTDRGFAVWMCTPDQLFCEDGLVVARATPVRTTSEAPHFHTSPQETRSFGDFDIVWMRKDPPFHMGYIFTTYLLDMAPEGTVVVNRPDGLKLFNEKMWVQLQWPELQPPTLISNDIAQITAYVRGRSERTVLKPWDGNGGRGVLVTDSVDPNLRSMVELLTEEGTSYVIAQGYLSGVVDGDKRILLFDGEPVAAMLRVPNAGDHRANMHAGASVVRCELDDADRAICDAIGPHLKKWGMLFVGIDVIDGKLTEVNVTSPTGIQELNQLYGLKLEADLVDRALALVAGGRQ
jgi:glutathione synthase